MKPLDNSLDSLKLQKVILNAINLQSVKSELSSCLKAFQSHQRDEKMANQIIA